MTDDDEAPEGRPKATLKPATLMRMATFYLARHSASTEHLRAVMARKIVRRLAADGIEAPDRDALRATIDPVIERLVRTGLLDDAGFARGKAASLANKGRPAWRIRADLAQHGVDAGAVGLDETLDALDPLTQARAWARRRRLGPFRPRERASHRERDIASLVRAGHAVGLAKAIVDGDGHEDGYGDDGQDGGPGEPDTAS